MSMNKVSLKIDELKPGMIAAEDIKFNNRVLVGSGVRITSTTITKLKKTYFQSKVLVYSDKPLDYSAEVANIEKSISEIEKSFRDLSNTIGELFTNMNYKSKTISEEIRGFTQKIQNELTYPNVVVKNIVLQGSGDDSIFRHSVNVAALSYMLGKWIGLSQKELNSLTYSAVLHDFGKTKIDFKILNKTEKLSESEFSKIKTHPILGYNFAKQIPFIEQSVLYGILMHHERLDGSGYPLGLTEEKIHYFAKIIAIADVFEAINSNRVYKRSMNPFASLETIQREALGKLDYDYCKILIEHIINYYIGEKVLLSNNSAAKIVHMDLNNLSYPLLATSTGFIDLKTEKNLHVKQLLI